MKNTIREVDATPYAASLIEGHRDFGYTLETALADVIDNSVSARATSLDLIANMTDSEPWIAIADDGSGMSEIELIEAMRLGSKNPVQHRHTKDLGRFGLGLKSASFSQCRRLTVITRKDGVVSCARWDLDHVAQHNDWRLELIGGIAGLRGSQYLPDSGTVVVWEKLDRLMGSVEYTQARRAQHMNAEIAKAERHLQVTFHRFLEGTRPRLCLKLNNRVIKPIDPMASMHPATQKDPEEVLRLGESLVRIRCHTLPHHKLMDKQEWDEIGGPEGHLKSQGLYVYRQDRLIIMGGWLGITRQTELTKLCRIAVDIPNCMDAEWKIDVKKSSAQLPLSVKDRLKKVIERFVGTSKRTYSRRGQKLVDQERYPIWNRSQKDGEIVFHPNVDHPVFRSFADQLPEELREGFERCLRILGSGLPIDTLYAELTGNAESVVSGRMGSEELEMLVHSLANAMLENGVSVDALSDALKVNPKLREQWSEVVPVLSPYHGLKNL